MLGVLPRLEQLSGRREGGDLASGHCRVVLIDSGEDEHRRAEGPYLVPGHADGEVSGPHAGGERLDLIAGEIVALVHELLTPRFPQVVEEFPVARGDPDRLLEDGRGNSFRRDCEQLQDERAADAAAEHQEPVDAEIIHDRELVCRVGTPRVAGVNTGNPVPCWVYQIFAPPLSTYGTRVSSRDSDSLTPAYGRAACYDRTRRRARPRRTGAYAQTCCAAALLMPPGHERRWLRHARPMATLASTDEAERRIVRPLP